MWHDGKPLFFDALEKPGRATTVKNTPLFVNGEKTWVRKKPSDINDVSNAKDTYTLKNRNMLPTEIERIQVTKNAKEIKSRSNSIDENKWMFTFMKAGRQI